MTKERRIAIEMWTCIAERLERKHPTERVDIYRLKKKISDEYGVSWYFGCWFCQYLRRDRKQSKEDNPKYCHIEGCQLCPLFKESYKNCIEEAEEEDYCGCMSVNDDGTTVFERVRENNDPAAAWKIVELLGGSVPKEYKDK